MKKKKNKSLNQFKTTGVNLKYGHCKIFGKTDKFYIVYKNGKVHKVKRKEVFNWAEK